MEEREENLKHIQEAKENGNKHVTFNGETFTLDERTGYYLKSRKPRKRLHIVVWEYYNKREVPKGCHIHHKDFNKTNNDISNLVCVTREEHNRIHNNSAEWSKERLEEARRNLNEKARPAAIAWHKSVEGREWHKEQWRNTLGTEEYQNKKIKKTCECCGIEYEVNNSNAKASRFCSNACKSKWRRQAGVDNIEVVCVECGEVFRRTRYSSRKRCDKCMGWKK